MNIIENEQKVKEKFSNLTYGEFRLLETFKERLGIDDLSFRNPSLRPQFIELRETFCLACKGFTDFLPAEDLTRRLIPRLEDLLVRLDPDKTLLVFPGNGSKAVKSLLPEAILRCFPSIDLQVIRKLDTNRAAEHLDILTPKNRVRASMPPKLEQCILVDDVIASRTTAQAVRSSLDERGKFDWYAASWLILSPLQVKKAQDDENQSGLLSFRKTITTMVYQGTSGIPASNSLSSFASTGEKAEAVISVYKKKYVEDQQTFDDVVKELRRLNEQI